MSDLKVRIQRGRRPYLAGPYFGIDPGRPFPVEVLGETVRIRHQGGPFLGKMSDNYVQIDISNNLFFNIVSQTARALTTTTGAQFDREQVVRDLVAALHAIVGERA